MAHILDVIEARVHNRRDRWHTEETPMLPPPEWMNEPTIVSRYSRVGLQTARRYLYDPVLISVDHCRETPSAVARDYLMSKYKHGPLWTKDQKAVVMSQVADHPLYCQPATFEEGFYVDIKSAYWSIMLRCGWDVDYYPGRWLGATPPPLDFPFADDKRARNSLVSVARASGMSVWLPDKNAVVTMPRGNPRANTQLYALISDALNGIASEAIEAGAVYVFTDGYIAPDQPTAVRISQIVEDWGFSPSIKGHGRGVVTALGSYIVGGHRTKELQSQPAPYRNVKKLEYHSWLRERLSQARSEAVWHDAFL